ncbi:hypothetical protein J7T55_001983 [Diaporthe amygdali]|uniref:uncharacterized protein n=1 Tax=Phomopsis amygdali TaxID=1214568 RepID=UPI0022FE17BB|nr:uncharacterized protein J7T55_001983 [Diaporthe amygdali]KAJ0117783.1 hypothetical protein J7T55_001983 [Diaporthe amygdali]
MSDSVTWNYDKPIYDQQKGRWYYEGRRPDGSKVRKYPPVGEDTDDQAAQHDSRSSYHLTPRNDASALAAGMQAMNIQPVGSYDGDAQHYTTVQPAGFSPATAGQGQTWSERRPSAYASSGSVATTESGLGSQQVDPNVYSQTPGTSQQSTGTDSQYPDGYNQCRRVSESSGGLSYQQYDDVNKEQPVSSYSGLAASSYDQQTTSGNTIYGALGSNQPYVDGYGVPPSGLMASNPDSRSQDKSRKHKHGSKAKGKGRAEADGYGGGGDGKLLTYNGPQYGGERSTPGGYYNEYSRQTSSGGPPYGTGSYAGQGGHASSQATRFGTSPTGVETTVDSIDRDLQALTREFFTDRGSTYQAAARDDLSPLQSHSKSTRPDIIRGTPGNSEYLDGRYRVEPSNKFEPGNVFKVMWSEPKGGTVPGGGSRFSDTTLLQDHMSGVWTGFRRFIVIRNGEGHCNCVPILTYGKLGCLKNGVKPHHHGIVFERGQQATRLANEPSLGFDPICMEMHPGEHISEESRVNYSKLVTVEHNVKVLFVGRVLYDDWPIVQQAVDSCWDAKKSHRSEHPGGGSSSHSHSHRSSHRKKSKGS